MKRVQKNGGDGGSAKRDAVVLAGLQLFTQYGYRKTSVDDIARVAQVAKRTVYLHFENKAAVFLAILEYLAEQVRQRCDAAEHGNGTVVDRLTGVLDAYFGVGFELFGRSEHMPELKETFSKLARTRIGDLNAEYGNRLAKFLRSLEKAGEIGKPPQGLSPEQVAHILIRSAEAAKHDPGIQGDRKALERRLRELAILAAAALKR